MDRGAWGTAVLGVSGVGHALIIKPHTPIPQGPVDSSHCKAHLPPWEITLIAHIIIYHHLSISTDYQLTPLLLLYYNSFQMLS